MPFVGSRTDVAHLNCPPQRRNINGFCDRDARKSPVDGGYCSHFEHIGVLTARAAGSNFMSQRVSLRRPILRLIADSCGSIVDEEVSDEEIRIGCVFHGRDDGVGGRGGLRDGCSVAAYGSCDSRPRDLECRLRQHDRHHLERGSARVRRDQRHLPGMVCGRQFQDDFDGPVYSSGQHRSRTALGRATGTMATGTWSTTC